MLRFDLRNKFKILKDIYFLFLKKKKATPFYLACTIGCLNLVKIFMADKRIDINLFDENKVKYFLKVFR